MPKKEAHLFSGLFIEFLHLLNITCFFQSVTVYVRDQKSLNKPGVGVYVQSSTLNFLCYPLIKILAVILWQMFRDFSGQFLPAYQGEYTKHRQNLLTTHMLYTKYCCSPRLYFEVCLYLHLFFEELYAFFMLIDCCAN